MDTQDRPGAKSLFAILTGCEVGMSEQPEPTDANDREPTGMERRIWVRYPCLMETLYQPGEGRIDFKWLMAEVKDIATGGMSLLLQYRFEPGTPLAIALLTSAPQFERTLQTHVVHVEVQEDGRWLTGCALSGILSDEELRALLS